MLKSFAISLLTVLLFAGCKREQRRFREPTPMTGASQDITMSELHPAAPVQDGQQQTQRPTAGLYSENAYAVGEGQKLYSQYNCIGCHANGGGGIGPPLIDSEWIYGAEPQNIFATIVQGRPNGMPAFRGKVSDQQVWEIVAYVRSMSGQLRKDVAPGRGDNMNSVKPPSQTPREHPRGPTGEQR